MQRNAKDLFKVVNTSNCVLSFNRNFFNVLKENGGKLIIYQDNWGNHIGLPVKSLYGHGITSSHPDSEKNSMILVFLLDPEHSQNLKTNDVYNEERADENSEKENSFMIL